MSSEKSSTPRARRVPPDRRLRNILAVVAGGGMALAGSTLIVVTLVLWLDNKGVDHDGALDDGDVATAADSEHLAGLETLTLRDNQLSDAAAFTLADSRHLANLEDIDLPRNTVSSDGAVALARSRHLGRLYALDLEGNAVGNRGARALVRGGRKRLGWLELSYYQIDPDLADRLARVANREGRKVYVKGNGEFGSFE
jgi:hypothetical protein